MRGLQAALRIGWRTAGVALLALAVPVARAAAPGLAEAPLAPRSGPPGRTLFTALPAAQTGLTAVNHYADPRMWSDHYQELTYGAMGTGVAVGDFDRDGRPDVFVVSKTGPGRLYRNLGNWKFADATLPAGLARAEDMEKTDRAEWTQGAVWADVNNDGWLDLYVCRFNAPNLLFINQRDGTFREEAATRGLAVTDASGMGAFCDYDRDGWLDVYVQTSMLDAAKAPRGQRDYLFHNRGDGTFENVTDRAGIAGESMGHSATWWDFDGDGWPDLYVANDYEAPDRLYRNNRDGTFTDRAAAVLPHTAYYAMGSDFGDVNNDGRIDFLGADMAATTRTKDLRGMALSRARAQDQAGSIGGAPQLMSNTLFLNTGTGAFQEAAHLAGFPATDWTWSPRFEDLDNDGRLDLFVTNGMNREYHNADLLDRIMALENPGDSRRYMKTMPLLAERHLAYRNLGDLRFEEVGQAWGLDQVGVSFGAGYGDFDGDGDLDIIHANYDGVPTVLRNDSPAGHRVTVALQGTGSNRYGVGTKATLETAAGLQVRQLVLARGYLSSSEPILHFGLGGETEIKSLTLEWPSGHRQVFTDLAADRRYTITEPAGPAAKTAPAPPPPGQFAAAGPAFGLELKAEENFEPETQPFVPVRFDRRGPALALGDLNRDGKTDLVFGGTGRQPAQIYFRADAFAAGGSLPAAVLDDGPLLLLDSDGDGLTDLLQTRAGASRPANSADYQPVLYRNSGEGFAPQPGALPPLAISVGAAVAADYDHDGKLDVFLGARVLPGKYPLSPRSALLHNAGGRFEDVTDALAPALREVGMVTSALWSDVDQDGWPDLLVALEWGGVRYFHNDQGRGFTDRSVAAGFAAAGSGWWTSLASADFNGDGRPDYAAGNAGLNTPYQAPALLYYGRFGGPPLAIEAAAENGRLQPLRARNELAAKLPALNKRFPRNDDYAQASLAEILGADKLAAAVKFEATQLQSGVFLSQPDGTYRFSPLPRIAQIAPVQGLAAGDFDGDGRADLYAVQNSLAPVPSVGRFDGGLSQLLLGDGRGGFTAVEPVKSGLVVPGDAKALVPLDLDADGWPDFLVSRNNATTLAWRNRGVPGRHSFQVVLPGRPGNPTGIGAALRLELADGTVQLAEIQAGGGYYSQSAPAAFFGWPDGNPPRRLSIRWPDGSTSEQALGPAVPPLLRVAAP